jgi:RNA polymerase sigma factor (sigma-70 family)
MGCPFVCSEEPYYISPFFIHQGKRTGSKFITGDFDRLIDLTLRNRARPLRNPSVTRVEASLLANLRTFVAFARQRVGDAHLAEDVVQASLVKALASAKQPANEEDTVAWFYRILRRSIIDLYRRRHAHERAMERLQQELPDAPTASDERLLCQCFKRLLPAVPEQYRELLQRIDLDGNDTGEVAAELGLTRNNLSVRLHRARKHLRQQVVRNCQACSKHGCLDCTCGQPATPVHRP